MNNNQVNMDQANMNNVQADNQMNNNANMQNNMNNVQNQNQMLSNPYINNTANNMQVNNAMQANPYINNGANNANVQNNNDAFFNGDFVKGALIGAGVAFLLTNKTTQGAIMNGFSKGSELVQAGIEELKERIEDAKAQMSERDS